MCTDITQTTSSDGVLHAISITKAQKKKIDILIGYTIKPFLQKNLK